MRIPANKCQETAVTEIYVHDIYIYTVMSIRCVRNLEQPDCDDKYSYIMHGIMYGKCF